MSIAFISQEREHSAEQLVVAARSARLWAAAAGHIARFYEEQALDALRGAGMGRRNARSILGSRKGDFTVHDEDVWVRAGYLNVLIDPVNRPQFTPFADPRRNEVALLGGGGVAERGAP